MGNAARVGAPPLDPCIAVGASSNPAPRGCPAPTPHHRCPRWPSGGWGCVAGGWRSSQKLGCPGAVGPPHWPSGPLCAVGPSKRQMLGSNPLASPGVVRRHCCIGPAIVWRGTMVRPGGSSRQLVAAGRARSYPAVPPSIPLRRRGDLRLADGAGGRARVTWPRIRLISSRGIPTAF